jgi:hypothetical protein
VDNVACPQGTILYEMEAVVPDGLLLAELQSVPYLHKIYADFEPVELVSTLKVALSPF